MVNHNKLKGLMVERGLKVEELAKGLKLSRQSVSDKINGRRSISLVEAAYISHALGMSSEERDAIFFSEPVKSEVT
jgi:transcriptional regulator with XRE-family HTH domain